MSVQNNYPILEVYGNHTCVCCLRQNVPFVNLFTCRHAGFLRELFNNKTTYPLNLVCRECHSLLIKFTDFTKQVEISIKLLNKQIQHTPDLFKKPVYNLAFSQVKCISTTNSYPEVMENVDLGQAEELDMKPEIVSDPIQLNHEVDIPVECIKEELDEEGGHEDAVKEEIDDDEEMPLSSCDNRTKVVIEHYISSDTNSETSLEDRPSTPPSISKAATNINNQLLPEKSKRQYQKAYQDFMKWKATKNCASFSQNVILVYFEELATKFKASSLWTCYSMLKSTLYLHHNVDIAPYTKVLALLKRKAEGHKKKTSNTFSPEEVIRFLKEAPDHVYLFTKTRGRPYIDNNVPSSSAIAEGAREDFFTQETGVLAKPKPYEDQVRVIALSKEEYLIERDRDRTKESFLKLPYRCDECVVGFDYEDTLKEHMQKRHQWVTSSLPGPSGIKLKPLKRGRPKLKKSVQLNTTKYLRWLPADLLALVDELHGKALKKNQILKRLRKEYGNNFDQAKVNSYLSMLAKAKQGPKPSLFVSISLSDLDSWIKSNDEIPKKMDTAFVLNHVIIKSEDNEFRFIMSTKRLLQNAVQCKQLILHTDSTHSLMWYNYPVILIGMSDRDQIFHLLAIAVCSNKKTDTFEFIFESLKTTVKNIFTVDLTPKVFVTDTAVEILSSFAKVFPDCPIRICWIHMYKILLNDLQSVYLAERELIMKDIVYLQEREDHETFSKCLQLFLAKWKNLTFLESAPSFVDYFTDKWVIKYSGWYEGFCPGTVSTNDLLDVACKALKAENTLPEKLEPKRFCSVVQHALELRSCKYTLGRSRVAELPEITQKVWRDAFVWTMMQKRIQLIWEGDIQEYIIPRGTFIDVDLSLTNMEDVMQFDHYVQARARFHRVYLPKNKEKWLRKGSCTCANFLKTYLCKHLVGIAIGFKCVYPPKKIVRWYNYVQRKRNKPEVVVKDWAGDK